VHRNIDPKLEFFNETRLCINVLKDNYINGEIFKEDEKES